jgi:hypothetical protein
MEEQSSRHIPQSIETMMELSNSAAVVWLNYVFGQAFVELCPPTTEGKSPDRPRASVRLESLLFQPIRQPETFLPRSC